MILSSTSLLRQQPIISWFLLSCVKASTGVKNSTCMAICRKSPWSRLDFTVPSSSLLQPTSECGERMMRNSWRSPWGRNSNSMQTGCSCVTTPSRHTTFGCCSSVSTATSCDGNKRELRANGKMAVNWSVSKTAKTDEWVDESPCLVWWLWWPF